MGIKATSDQEADMELEGLKKAVLETVK